MPITYDTISTTYNPQTYTYTITTHGAPYCALTSGSVNQPGTAQIQSGYAASQQWAQQMPPDTKRIVLRACHGADGGLASTGQQLANASGRPVATYSGETFPGPYPDRIFQPQTGFQAQVSGYANRLFSPCK